MIENMWTGFSFYRNFFKSSCICLLLFSFLYLLCGCKDDDHPPVVTPIPNTCLVDNEILISDIAGIPEKVSFNKVIAEITGDCWEVITLVEADYKNGKITLSLPAEFPSEKLQKVVRSHASDYCACWPGTVDNSDALVAKLGDVFAYNDNEKVGRIYLSDWSGEGSSISKSFVSYHYTDRPFNLSGSFRTYKYEASFKTGWNAYVNYNIDKDGDDQSVLCTTSIPEETPLVWHFESYVY